MFMTQLVSKQYTSYDVADYVVYRHLTYSDNYNGANNYKTLQIIKRCE